MSSVSEYLISNLPKPDPTDIFIDVMTSSEIQVLLKTSTSTRNHIWTDVVCLCSRKGLEFGDNASEKARLKWLHICKALRSFCNQKTRKKTSKTIKPRHLERLLNFIKAGGLLLNVSDQRPEYEREKDKIEEKTPAPLIPDQEFPNSPDKSDPASIVKSILMSERNQIEIDDARWERRDKKFGEIEALFEHQTLKRELVASLLLSKHCTSST